jgi:hypothetical protein
MRTVVEPTSITPTVSPSPEADDGMVDPAQQRDLLVEPLDSFSSHLVSSGSQRQLALAESPSSQLSRPLGVRNPSQYHVGDTEQNHRYRVDGLVHRGWYVPKITQSKTDKAIAITQVCSRVRRGQTFMHSPADAPRFHCPSCDATTPHTFQIHRCGDKPGRWICETGIWLRGHLAAAGPGSSRSVSGHLELHPGLQEASADDSAGAVRLDPGQAGFCLWHDLFPA